MKYNLMVVKTDGNELVYDVWFENDEKGLYDMFENISEGLCKGYSVMIVSEQNDLIREVEGR